MSSGYKGITESELIDIAQGRVSLALEQLRRVVADPKIPNIECTETKDAIKELQWAIEMAFRLKSVVCQVKNYADKMEFPQT